MKLYAQVALPLPLYKTFTYRVPSEIQEFIKVGMSVVVPFRQRELRGVVVKLPTQSGVIESRVKNIQEIAYSDFCLSSRYLSFSQRLADYFLIPWGEILELAFPRPLGDLYQKRVKLTEKGQESITIPARKLSAQEKRILEFIRHKDYSLFYLRRKLKEIDVISVVSRLKKKGLVEVFLARKSHPLFTKIEPKSKESHQLSIPFLFGDPASFVFQEIMEKIKSNKARQFYLRGSVEWRQEIYLLLIERLLSQENQVLILVPEISHGTKLVTQLQDRFGEAVVFFHSQLTPKKIWSTWKEVVEGRARIIVGPRSALFLPCPRLALIIVEEEPATSYYQMEKPRYDPRKGAWIRAEEEGAGVVFGGSVPRVETYLRCQKKGFVFSETAKKEANHRVIIDEFISAKELFSPKLKEKLHQAAEDNQQCLLFFNRLGRSFHFFCPNCHQFLKCPDCGKPVLERAGSKKKVSCPSGHVEYSGPLKCPQCQRQLVKYKEYGIDRVVKEVKKLFPQAKVSEVSSESMISKKKLDRMRRKFINKKIDFLIGTEMILHQPLEETVDMAVALLPEIALELPEFDAGEKMYQSLNKLKQFLSSTSESKLWIQTSLPEHHVFRAFQEGDYEFFYKKELDVRQMMHLPPFFRLIQVFFWGKPMSQLGRESRAFLAYLTKITKIDWVGPNLTFHPQQRRVRGVQLLLRIPSPKFDLLIDKLKDYFRQKNLSPWIRVQG